ncbi:phytanoyl-CoA dioxygenase family protein [Cumulibacter soli]|uniref:phytanoyl-CoA dioxygenase family protein n=1 Tax=Cumulibacter soli TaxID=2546344 RepID=UPI0010678DBF|nr:phytanoyl-CoA dioxygenase family protein [Cumulibacter soli]
MSEMATGLSLPEPTSDLRQAERDLQTHGICLVAQALPGPELERVRDRLVQAMEDDHQSGFTRSDFGLDKDTTNQRVWGLLSRGAPFVELVQHPTSLRLLRSVLGADIALSSISSNITFSGGGESLLHADMTYMPEPWAGPEGANAIWLVDDFTEENGATIVIPGSHLWNRMPTADDQQAQGVPLEAPAGTLVVMEGRVWHKTGSNRTDGQRRAGIFSWYTKPIYRTQENFFLSLNPQTLQTASDELLQLLGYDMSGLGRVNGEPARSFLRGESA